MGRGDVIHNEPNRESADQFEARYSSELLQLFTELAQVTVWAEQTLDESFINKIKDSLENLKDEAQKIGDKAKAEILGKLWVNFHQLLTVGFVGNSEKFADKAGHAFDLLQTALLSIPSTKDQVLASIQEERERYG